MESDQWYVVEMHTDGERVQKCYARREGMYTTRVVSYGLCGWTMLIERRKFASMVREWWLVTDPVILNALRNFRNAD